MRPPAHIQPHLPLDGMLRWVKDSPDEHAHKRRMAIWLTRKGRLHAAKVAEAVGVSVQAVRLWIGQYNRAGPGGLERKGRGGRRRAFLSVNEESRILRPFLSRVRTGDVPRASEVKSAVETLLGRRVSMAYIYKLLSRHGWAQTAAQSQGATTSPPRDTFAAITPPSQRRPWKAGAS
jgi:transposase